MQRENIDKIAKNQEDRVLLAKVFDKISGAMRRNLPAATGFLTPREQEMCRYLFGDAEGQICFGGYEDAERKMLVYLPDYLDESYFFTEDSPICCLRATFFEANSLTHRDLLGALMGCGIERYTIGDICIASKSCDFLASAQIAPYILQNLTSAGRISLQLKQIPLQELHVPEPEIKEIRDTLASLRLDCVVASGFRMGRALAAQHIHAGKVAVDGLPCEKPDKPIPEGAKVSLRGTGKIKVAAIGGTTKKDRISVIIHRYM